MNEFFVSFTVGFLCTLTLFSICFLIALGGKVFLGAFKRYISEKFYYEQSPEVKSAKSPKQPKSRKPKTIKPTPKPVKSIEIDPLEIDRIYVKKSS